MTIRATLFTLVLVCLGTTLGGVGAAQQPTTGVADDVGPAVQENCSVPVSKTDTTGAEVTIEERPQRIVVLQPSDAQIVWEIGAQDRVVGMPRTQYTSYLNDRGGKTNIKNDDLSISIEQVVGLQPDLVLAANATDIETVRELRRDGLTVYHFGNVRSLDEIATNVETVGRVTGDCEAARERADEFRQTVESVRQATAQREQRPSVLYYFFDFTTGSDTHIHDVIETAGGENVAATAGIQGYKQVNAEIVASQNPSWIVYPDDATIPQESPYTETTAVQRNQTLALDSQYISQPGPRVAIPLSRLSEALNSTENATQTTQSSSSGPGFGVGAALVAVVSVALLARRD